MDNNELDAMVRDAINGDKGVLLPILNAIKPDIYALSVRFLWNPHDAEDACQEILLKVATNIHHFRSESRFKTWVFRIASNHLFHLKKQSMETQNLSFEMMSEDLSHTLDMSEVQSAKSQEDQYLLEEIRIGCTLAMLQCLDRKLRMTYILGEILEFEHAEASMILDISTAAYRKRLSRAREKVSDFVTEHCGMVSSSAKCACPERVTTAIQMKRVDPQHLIFSSRQQVPSTYAQIKQKIAVLEESQRTAAVYRMSDIKKTSKRVPDWLKNAIDVMEVAV